MLLPKLSKSVVQSAVTVGCCILLVLTLSQNLMKYRHGDKTEKKTIPALLASNDAHNSENHLTSKHDVDKKGAEERLRLTSNTKVKDIEEDKDWDRNQLKSKDNVQVIDKAGEEERFRLPSKLRVGVTQNVKDDNNISTNQNESVRLEGAKCGQENRQRLLRETCDWGRTQGLVDFKESKLRQNLTVKSLLVDDVHKVLYCELPKAACTSWKVFFANLSGKVDPKDYDRLHRLVHNTDYYPTVGFRFLASYNYEDIMYRLKNYYKFMVVRNPFTRLVSAYENKFVPNITRTEWFQRNIGSQIIRNYRKQPSMESLQDGKGVLFEELVKFVADNTNMAISRRDQHWWKMHEICRPCLIKYDYIAKLETMDEDVKHILERIDPGGKVKFPYLNVNSYEMSHYKTLSRDSLKDIEKFYDVDSKMFGYSLFDNSLEC